MVVITPSSTIADGQARHLEHHLFRFCGLLPLKLFGLLGIAIHHGWIGKNHPLSQPHNCLVDLNAFPKKENSYSTVVGLGSCLRRSDHCVFS